MFKKSSIWLVVLISVVAIAFVASGCAKKQVVKEEAAPKPAVEAKKEEPTPEVPQPVEKPKEEVPKPPVAPPVEKPKEEAKIESKPEAAAKPEEKPAPLDLAGLRIQFAFDDYNLSNQSKENLNKIATWMSKKPATKIQIQGHTCDIGTAEYNLALGDRRANSAKKYLEGLGISTGRLLTISYGLEKPRVPNADEANRSLNRRDEFLSIK